eukprot:9428530-Pyramimonas_sp.AAC.1
MLLQLDFLGPWGPRGVLDSLALEDGTPRRPGISGPPTGLFEGGGRGKMCNADAPCRRAAWRGHRPTPR